MTLNAGDALTLKTIERVVNEYKRAINVPAMPLGNALVEALGGKAELYWHEVATDYLRGGLKMHPEVVRWILTSPMAVEAVYRVQERLLALTAPDGEANPEARERARLRQGAEDGACPTCGATEPSRADALLDSYARATTRLHAALTEAERANEELRATEAALRGQVALDYVTALAQEHRRGPDEARVEDRP